MQVLAKCCGAVDVIIRWLHVHGRYDIDAYAQYMNIGQEIHEQNIEGAAPE